MCVCNTISQEVSDGKEMLAITSTALAAGALLRGGAVRPICAEVSSVDSHRVVAPTAGLFDNLFTETPEQKARKAQVEAAKEAEFREQQEMLARRRDPKKMEEYLEQVEARRIAESARDRDLKNLQQQGNGQDVLEDWKALKDAGKVLTSETAKRDKGSERLGSEGLVPERLDEQMPYIDQGYVET